MSIRNFKKSVKKHLRNGGQLSIYGNLCEIVNFENTDAILTKSINGLDLGFKRNIKFVY